MMTIIFRREKCIGCNYCVEIAPVRWAMSKKDGKSNLIGSSAKKGIHIVRVNDIEETVNRKAAEACPVKVIEVKT